MRLKPGWDKVTEEKLPDALRSRVLEATRAEMARKSPEAAVPWQAHPYLWFGGVGVVTALMVLFALRPAALPEEAAFVADDLEMIRDAEMIQDLQTLRALVKIEKTDKKKWTPEKT